MQSVSAGEAHEMLERGIDGCLSQEQMHDHSKLIWGPAEGEMVHTLEICGGYQAVVCELRQTWGCLLGYVWLCEMILFVR